MTSYIRIKGYGNDFYEGILAKQDLHTLLEHFSHTIGKRDNHSRGAEKTAMLKEQFQDVQAVQCHKNSQLEMADELKVCVLCLANNTQAGRSQFSNWTEKERSLF